MIPRFVHVVCCAPYCAHISGRRLEHVPVDSVSRIPLLLRTCCCVRTFDTIW